VALYRAGWKQKDIAEDVGCSDSVVSKVLQPYKANGRVRNA